MRPATQPDARQEPVKLSIADGYSRWSKFYDSKWNTLIATEERYSLGMLDSLAGRDNARHRSGNGSVGSEARATGVEGYGT